MEFEEKTKKASNRFLGLQMSYWRKTCRVSPIERELMQTDVQHMKQLLCIARVYDIFHRLVISREFFDRSIRDQLVCGTRNQAIWKKCSPIQTGVGRGKFSIQPNCYQTLRIYLNFIWN